MFVDENELEKEFQHAKNKIIANIKESDELLRTARILYKRENIPARELRELESTLKAMHTQCNYLLDEIFWDRSDC